MTVTLIDVDVLFQTLLVGLDIEGLTVEADLGPESSGDVPTIIHRATLAQSGNGPELWHSVLSVSLFIEASTATFPTIQAIYAGIHSWGESPYAGIVPDVGAVEEVADIEAFTRLGQGVSMDNKFVTQYVGSFELSLRNI